MVDQDDASSSQHGPYAIADALQRKNVPFIFATGYGSTGLRQEYGNRPVLQKPFQARDFEAALTEALNGTNVAAG